MKKEEVIIQTEDVKVRVVELQPGESGPFHFHTQITDTMFGVSGEITVHLKSPAEQVKLKQGVRCRIEPGRVHKVSNDLNNATAKYLLIQGVGAYDFIEEDI